MNNRDQNAPPFGTWIDARKSPLAGTKGCEAEVCNGGSGWKTRIFYHFGRMARNVTK
jgi:hypothetical protein